MSKKKLYKGVLSFSKEERMINDVALVGAGISMPPVSNSYIEKYKEDNGYKSSKDWLQFGMLGNDPKYDQNINVSDIAPRPEDFVQQPFRLLSATIVGGGTWKATDFSNTKVLKASAPMLEGKPLYKDHETDLDNWVGLVTAVKWTKSFTDSNGLKIPAGIDGIVAVDAKTNPKVARGLLMGSIYSNSVTVKFDYEMSHPFDNEWEFLDKVGTIGSDGKMVRRIVHTIYDYHESSLVWLGADPYAKAVTDDGDLKNVDISSVFEYTKQQFKKDGKKAPKKDSARALRLEKSKKLTINFALTKNILSLTHKNKETNNNKLKSEKMKEFVAAFILAFGKQLNLSEGTTLSQEQILEHITTLSKGSPQRAKALKSFKAMALEAAKKDDPKAKTVKLSTFSKGHSLVSTERLTQLETDAALLKETDVKLKDAEKKVKKLKSYAKTGREFLSMKREEAIRLYKTSVGSDKADDAVVALFEKADSKAIDGLLKQYTKKATHKFSGKCSDCGSSNFKFQSSMVEDGGTEEDEESLDVSADAIREQFDNKDMHLLGKSE